MSSSGDEYIRCQMRLKGGKRSPKSTERKSAGADRIITLIEKGIHGCRLSAPAHTLNEAEAKYVEELNWFNSLPRDQQLRHLIKKLRKLKQDKADLYKKSADTESEQKRVIMRRRLREPIIDLQIEEVMRQIEEIEDDHKSLR